MVRTLLAAAILVGTSTLALAQSVAAPLIVSATVVSSCKVRVPRQVERSALSIMPIDVECTRGSVDARVRRPPPSQSHVGDALVVINF